jgi:vitamin B12 transporter
MCRTLLLTGILGGLIPALSLAQDLRSGNAQPVSSYDETVVVTATLEEEERGNLSASVTVISQEMIAERQATEVAELLATTAGLAVVQSGSPGTITSLFSRGSNSAHTLVLWNGVQINDLSSGLYDWAHLSTEGIERIEIARGPYSALFGSDAIGGVVQILSKSEPGVSARVEAGSDAYRRGSVVAAAQGGRWRVDASGHSRRGDSELPNDTFANDEFAAHGLFTFASGNHIGLRLRWNDADLGIPRDYLNAPSPERHQKRNSLELVVPARFAWGRFEVEAQAARTTSDLELVDPGNPFDRSQAESNSEQGRAVLSYRPRAGLWVAGGADWERQEAATGSAFGPGLADHHQRTLGLFAQAGWSWERWRFDAGLRRDDNDAFGAETTTKFGAVWRGAHGVRVRGSYGEGFHAPTLADLYFPGFSNPDLSPERSASAELAVELENGPWRGSLAAFSTDFTDLIQFDFVTFTPFNTGRARSRGLELELGFVVPAWSVRGNGTYLEAEDRASGAALLRRPRESANLVVTWKPSVGSERFQLHAVSRFVGARADFGGELPSYTTVEVGGGWHPARVPWLKTYARLENALARQYQEVATYPAPGRRWVGGVGLRF